MLVVVLILILILLALAYIYFTSTFDHWKKNDVPFVRTYPLAGSLGSVLMTREHIASFYQKVYREFPDHPYVGFFQVRTPALLIRDPELVKRILISDFSHFTDHGFEIAEETDPLLAKHLFNMNGSRWKQVRTKISNPFTPNRLRGMFDVALKISKRFEDHLKHLVDSCSDIDIKRELSFYSTDSITSSAFGFECNSISEPGNIFRKMSQKFLAPDLAKLIKAALILFAPKFAQLLKLQFSDMEVIDFFRSLVRDVISTRKNSEMHRKDYMQLLLDLREKLERSPCVDGKISHEEKKSADCSDYKQTFTVDDIAAQALIAFLAGSEISPIAITFAVFELAQDPILQRRAREEIDQVLLRHDKKLSFDALQEITFLDNIFLESLRKYPPLGFLNRICTKDYDVPGTEIRLEKGHLVVIPALALHNDPIYFPEPEKFMPQRFDEKLNFVQRPFMPFGDGPRHCTGNRFVLMQAKLGLLAILNNFEILPSDKTSYPLIIERKSLLLSAKGHVFIKLRPVIKN